MKNLLLFVLLMTTMGCHMIVPAQVDRCRHTNYVATMILKKINNRKAQERGYCIIDSTWYAEQGLSDRESQAIYDYFTGRGFTITLHQHTRHQIGSWGLALNQTNDVSVAFTVERVWQNDVYISW